jgi:putative Ca2+/H+ antiporter (TMEM165/GDT1 family)
VIDTGLSSAAAGPPAASAQSPGWHRPALILFACVNAASIGTFFAVFVGAVLAPPHPRNAVFLLVTGGLAFAVLVMGQFVHWSQLALRRVKERRP